MSIPAEQGRPPSRVMNALPQGPAEWLLAVEIALAVITMLACLAWAALHAHDIRAFPPPPLPKAVAERAVSDIKSMEESLRASGLMAPPQSDRPAP